MERIIQCARECNLEGNTSLASDCLQRCDPLLRHYGMEPDVALPSWAAILIAAGLVPLSALFSGLTLGLLSLDPVALKIVAQAGSEQERRYAARIMPIRAKGNLLLCTLLFGNVCVNSAISIVLSDITSGVMGLLLSTIIIVVLGEVVPQAVCNRHALYIGAHSIWLVHVFMLLFLPVTLPISKVLDWALGRDVGQVFSQEELKRLIDIHVHDPDAQQTSGLTQQDQQLIIGAMSYKDKRVEEIMTPLQECFMLDAALRLDAAAIVAIYKSGYTRIPVFQGSPSNVVGILYAKDLVLVNPLDELELGTLVGFRGQQVGRTYAHERLDRVLQCLMVRGSHMLIVHRDPPDPGAYPPYYAIADAPVVGLLTLEDVLEELIQADIHDETDVVHDSSTQVSGAGRRKSRRARLNHLVALYESRYGCVPGSLTDAESSAVAAFLAAKLPSFFGQLGQHEAIMQGLLGSCQLVVCDADTPPALSPADRCSSAVVSHISSIKRTAASFSGLPMGTSSSSLRADASKRAAEGRPGSSGCEEGLFTAPLPWATGAASGWLLYQRGQPSVCCTVVLQGKVLVKASREGFELPLGPWNVLGQGALERGAAGPYVADFDAVAVPPCRLLRIPRPAYLAAADALRQRVMGMAGGKGSLRHKSSTVGRYSSVDVEAGNVAAVDSGVELVCMEDTPLLSSSQQ